MVWEAPMCCHRRRTSPWGNGQDLDCSDTHVLTRHTCRVRDVRAQEVRAPSTRRPPYQHATCGVLRIGAVK
eukprot:6541889-Pyramimonas_sp.AAC.1